MKFSLNNLAKELIHTNKFKTVVVGISGGVDSMVLLHAVNKLVETGGVTSQVKALHINHGLHQASNDWESFCCERCANLGIPLQVERLSLKSLNKDGVGLENRARQARYAVFESIVDSDCCLILAHHLDDQLETLIFRLNRGAGMKGLRAIPQSRELGNGKLFRPLLRMDRKSLCDFAKSQKLQWIDDDSNQDISFDRNFLRHKVLPNLERRWPNYRESWAKSLELISEAQRITEEVASDDFTALSSNTSNKLILSALINLAKARQRNVMKYWLKKIARKEIGWNKLQHIVNEVLPVATYSNVEVAIEDYLIRSYRNQLYLLKEFGPLPETCHWDIRDLQELPLFNNGIICAHKTIGEGISHKLIENLDVRFRKGGEKLRMRGRPQKSLKKIFQEARIEPWIRPRIPLIYSGDELICAVGVGVSALALADRGEAGVSLTWQMPQN